MSITKLKRGGFRIDVQSNGKRVREKFMGTMKEAEAREVELRNELSSGLKEAAPASHKVTMRKLFELTVQENWSKCRCDSGIRRARMILTDFIGWDTPASEVTSQLVADMAQFYRDKGNSESTVNRKKAALSAMFKKGKELELITTRPTIGMTAEDNGRERWLTEEEEAVMLKAALEIHGEEYQFFLMFLIDTGCRRGEALAAQSSWLYGDGIVIPTKVSKSKRPRRVPLTKRVIERLPKSGALFPSYYGRDSRHLYLKLRKVKEAAGIDKPEEILYHTLRHTCATRLLSKGVGLKAIQQWLGHSSSHVTNRYAHLELGSLDGARDLLEANHSK